MPCLLFFAFCFFPPSSLCVSCSVHLSHFVILQRPRHGSSWPGSPRRRMPRRPATSRACRPHHLATAIFFSEVHRRAPASSAVSTRPAPSPARSPACIDHAPRPHAPGPPPLRQIRPSHSSASARQLPCVGLPALPLHRLGLAQCEQLPQPPVSARIVFFSSGCFSIYPRFYRIAENPLLFMHLITK